MSSIQIAVAAYLAVAFWIAFKCGVKDGRETGTTIEDDKALAVVLLALLWPLSIAVITGSMTTNQENNR